MQELNTLKEFTQSSDPLMLVLGEAGSGKTELLKDLVLHSTLSKPIIFLHGRNQIKPRLMLQALTQHLNISVEDHGQPLVEQLQMLVNGLTRKQHVGTLVIDDAHLLPFSILAALIHIVISQQGQHCYLHLILAGRVSLEDKVRTLHEQAMRIVRLGKMPRHETRQHIENFLEQTHINATADVIDTIVERLHQQSHGVPSRIDKMLRELTLKDFMTARKQSTTHDAPAKRRRLHMPFTQEVVLGERGARGFAVFGLFAAMFGLYWYEHHTHYLAPALPSTPYHYAMSKPRPINEPTPAAQPLAAKPPTVQPSATPSLAEHQATPHAAIQQGYTIQLMGSFSKADAEQKLNSLHMAQAQIIQEQYQQKPWFIVGIGHYMTRQQAQQSLQQLPKTLRQAGAWVRPLS